MPHKRLNEEEAIEEENNLDYEMSDEEELYSNDSEDEGEVEYNEEEGGEEEGEEEEEEEEEEGRGKDASRSDVPFERLLRATASGAESLKTRIARAAETAHHKHNTTHNKDGNDDKDDNDDNGNDDSDMDDAHDAAHDAAHAAATFVPLPLIERKRIAKLIASKNEGKKSKSAPAVLSSKLPVGRFRQV